MNLSKVKALDKLKARTVRGSGEGVVNDGVQGTGPSGGGHSRESWDQTGKDEELLLSTVVPQRLQPQQEEADPLAADLGERGRHIVKNAKEKTS